MGSGQRGTMAARANSVRPELLLLGSMSSVQFGSAFADTVFHRAGPGGVAFLRVAFTAVVLLCVARPSLRGRTRREITTVLTYGLFLAGMNWSFYEGLHRLPLGVAVTIEFTGPLAVAFAGSRRKLDVLWAVLAAAGVVLLALRGGDGSVHLLGVLLVLVAAFCWAMYIVLAKRVGTSFGTFEALAIAMSAGSLLVLPAGLVEGGTRLLHPVVLGSCLLVSLLSSLIPYSLELVALRRLSTGVFGLLMSLEPAVAAIAGVIVLGQPLTLALGIALVLVVSASVGVTVVGHRPTMSVDGQAQPEA